jgi:hypothetical protein
MKNTSIDLDLFGHNHNHCFIDGAGSDLFIAAGCSWTRAWGSVDDCLYFSDPNFKDNKDFIKNRSYAGIMAKNLGIDRLLMLAIPGSNNETQSRLLIEFLQKNRHLFKRIFVLWGLTSHLRWELYSNNINAPSMFMLGSPVPPGKERERKWYLVNHWNEQFELIKLGQRIVLTSSYLDKLDVEHLFFPVFESFGNHNMDLRFMSDKNYFYSNNQHNDMLSQWCNTNNIARPQQILSNPFDHQDQHKLDQLIDLGYLNARHAHPSAKGHADIAERLIQYINLHQ